MTALNLPYNQHNNLNIEIKLDSINATKKLGLLIANCLQQAKQNRLIIYLDGELGVGKTTLMRNIIQNLGYTKTIKSPSYSLVEPYIFDNVKLYHFDLYRLSDPDELEYIGIRDYFSENAWSFIEWAERGINIIPQADLIIKLNFSTSNLKKRLAYIKSNSIIGNFIYNPLIVNYS